ncbi:hypothetical protein ABZ733_27420 [Streptomyces longwoodensis]|uniref:hypothetical protein n=1 Tax=Streptomyces longwoodensis TaxID=68231 RepID=UPI0033D6A1EC
MTIFAAVALAVLGFGNTEGAGASGNVRHTPSVTYPIRFNHANDAPPGAVPHPAVSYPIKFDTPTPRRATPAPSVSYPIDFSALGRGR